jgi:ADP-heptose:LPS heptosyltransferase
MLTPATSAPTLRVAIYRTSSLGDVILASACLDLLTRLDVPTEVTWLGRGAALATLGAGWPSLKTIEVKNDDGMRESQRLVERLANIHLFIDLQVNLRSQLLARALRQGGAATFAADKTQVARGRLLLESRLRGRRRPLPAAARRPARLQYQAMVDALWRGLVHHLPIERYEGLDPRQARPRLHVPEELDQPWRKELRFGEWLAVAPGAAHATKQAPLELVREILDRTGQLLAPQSVGLLFLGDANDRTTANELMRDLNWTGRPSTSRAACRSSRPPSRCATRAAS